MSTYRLDHTDACAFLATIGNDTVHLYLTDPPYGISRDTGFKTVGDKGVERFRVSMDFGQWDHLPPDELTKLLTDTCQEAYRILQSGGVAIVFFDLWKLETLSTILKYAGFRMLRLIEWQKTNPVPLNSKRFYLSNSREVAIACVKGSKPTFQTKYHNGVFSMPIHRDGGKRLHPTQKPLALMKDLIEIHTKPGQIVVDPFAGSGTTIVAAVQLGREGWGCEIDKKYHKKAQVRLQKLDD